MERLEVPRQKLLQQIAAQRQEINLLHQRCGTLEQKQQDYQQTLLFVGRSWEQLHDDLLYMLSRASGDALPALSADAAPSDVPEHLTNLEDPFLRRLLAGSDAATVKAAQEGQRAILAAGLSDVEQKLDERLDVTKEALGKLLDLLARQHAAAAQQGDGAPDAAGQHDPDALRRSMDALRALQRNSAEHARASDDKVTELQQRVRDLTTQLAEREQQVLNLVKKLNSGGTADPKAAAEAALGLRGSSAGGTSSGGGGGAAAAAAAAADEALALLQRDLQAAQEQLGAAKASLDTEREAHLRTQHELQQALARPPEEGAVAASPWYQQRCAAQAACDRARALEARQPRRL
jgi:hypothetical protein